MLDGGWLFPGLNPIGISAPGNSIAPFTRPPTRPASTSTCRCTRCATLRHPPAGAEGRHPPDPGAARAQETRNHRPLRPGRHRHAARSGQSAGEPELRVGRHGAARPGGRGHLPRLRAGVASRPAGGHLSLGQLKVMSAIEQCRTAALGGHVLRCEACEQIEISYNSCRNRHCPKCQARAAQRWLEARQADLLPVEYYHVVFTLPRRSAHWPTPTRRWSTGCCSRWRPRRCSPSPPIRSISARTIGATLVLHTWGSAMTHHPHVHGIVPGGGLSADGQRWIACRRGFFLPVRVLSRLFRRRFLEELEKRITPACCASSASSPRWPNWPRSCAGSRRCARANGWSMPSGPSPAPRRCSPTCRATPIGWRSRTVAWCPSTPAASPSAGRTTAPRGAPATRR
jgi:hypothetical protein